MAQRYTFGLADHLLCDLAGIRPYDMHTDVSAIIKAADAAAPLAGHLGIEPPRPHLYGMSYCQLSTLGSQIINRPELEEPWAEPCLDSPRDIDRLKEPDDYLSGGIVPRRLELAKQLQGKRPDASISIGHDYEGPATTAGLMLGGPAFFTLPFDDPPRAHKLLEFVTRTSVNYCRAIRAAQGRAFGGQPEGIPDDFAGMFPPETFARFVVPCWEGLYSGLGATARFLHSELLREGHLRYLKDLRIDDYDPSVDQYLTPEILQRSCPVKYGLRIWPSQVRDLSVGELVGRYRYLASFKPSFIMFHMAEMSELPKIEGLLKVAREGPED